MEFIKMTTPDYRRTLIRTALVAPTSEVFFGNRKMLLLCIFPYIALFIQGLPEGVGDLPSTVKFIVSMQISVVLALVAIHVLLSILMLLPRDISHHRKFVSEIKKMDSVRYEKLLSEYTSARMIEFYYDKGKKIRGAQTIFATESYLCFPGFFVIWRDEIIDVAISGPSRGGATAFIFIREKQKEKAVEFFTVIRFVQKQQSRLWRGFGSVILRIVRLGKKPKLGMSIGRKIAGSRWKFDYIGQ